MVQVKKCPVCVKNRVSIKAEAAANSNPTTKFYTAMCKVCTFAVKIFPKK